MSWTVRTTTGVADGAIVGGTTVGTTVGGGVLVGVGSSAVGNGVTVGAGLSTVGDGAAVGADAAAIILAEEPHLLDEISLVVDVGTNAEIVLGNRDRLLACSSPTGPAFEGAQISCGQRAAPGAIERVRIDRQTLEVRFSVIGSELWSDDPGFEESIQAIGVTGICGSGKSCRSTFGSISDIMSQFLDFSSRSCTLVN